ncbi:hypothetical protein ACFZCP_03465 [Streptomyces sp. NPDC007971]|uniref:hypothetical protein n=1 Tax=Streptomyces sp. NPDC007971 TaxID=3364799 RepID=UPI0036E36258
MGLYIETRIRADLDELWARTQDPAQHRRWDLRVREIQYLPRTHGRPRRFRYAARVLPFLTVSGTGVAASEKDGPDGSRTSALRFSSRHPFSPVAEGSGYWRYVPDGGQGVRFLTGYDYRPRGGAFGAMADRLVLRPLTGWATAWSFDRLRLWLERGITPERALANWLAELVVRALVLTMCCAGLGLEPVVRVFGEFAAAVAYLCPLLLMVAMSLALLKEPLACTPAARRCLRTPVTQACTPRVLRTLEKYG